MKYLVFDVETTGLEVYSDFICASWVVFTDKYKGETVQTSTDVLDLVTAMSKADVLVGHNIISFDLPLLSRLTYKISNLIKEKKIYDTLVMSRQFFPMRMRHSVEAWVDTLKHNQYMHKYLQEKVEIDRFEQDNLSNLIKRCEADVIDEVIILSYILENKPEQLGGYEYINHSASFIVEMLAGGIPFDKAKATEIYNHLCLEECMNRAYVKLALDIKNYNSVRQIDQALKKFYGKGLPLGPPSKKKGERNPRMSKDDEEELVKDFPILKYVFAVKDLEKQQRFIDPNRPELKTTFFNRHREDRTYPSLGLCSTVTYRSQYSSPPLNQMDKRIRKCITIEGKGKNTWHMVGFDLESCEMRILAHALVIHFGDHTLEKKLNAGVCPKQETLDVFGKLFDKVKETPTFTKKDMAKKINFATLYGQQATTTTSLLNLPDYRVNDVQHAIDVRFPELNLLNSYLTPLYRDKAEWLKGKIDWDYGNKQKYYTTIKNMFNQNVKASMNTLVNYYCQSSGATYSKMMFSCLHEEMDSEGMMAQPFVFNHDELNYVSYTQPIDGYEGVLERTYKRFKETYDFPIISNLNYQVGKNWSEIH